MKHKQLKKYLKLIILLFAVSLLVINCQVDDALTFDNTKHINSKTVSFDEAKTFFGQNQNNNNQYSQRNSSNTLILNPDWNSLEHSDLVYTNAQLTKADTNVNRTGDYTSKLLFINIDNQIQSVILTTWVTEYDAFNNIINAIIYFNDYEGKFIDAYKIEDGLFTHKLMPSSGVQTANFFMFFQDQFDVDDCWNTDTLPDDGSDITIEVDLGTVSGGSSGGGSSSGNSGGTFGGTYGGYINGGVSNGGGFVSGTGGSNTRAITRGGIDIGAASILMNPPNNQIEEPKEPEDPCKRMKELEEDTFLTDFYTAIEHYANDDDVNFEVGFAMTKQDDGSYSFAALSGNQNQPYLPFTLADDIKIDIYMHSHYKGLLSIFGTPDLLHYHDLLTNHSENGTNLVYILRTNADTRYAIKVNNIAKFNAVANLNLYDDEKLEKFIEEYFKNVNDDNDNATNELNFLKGLKSANMGLSLFEANSDYTEWKELTLDPNDENNIIPIDCN